MKNKTYINDIKSLKKQEREFEKQTKTLRENIKKQANELSQENMKRYIGRCFCYGNAYSPDQTWKMWIKILGVTKNGLQILTAEKTSNNELHIERRDECGIPFHLCEYKLEISSHTFDQKYHKILDEIKDL